MSAVAPKFIEEVLTNDLFDQLAFVRRSVHTVHSGVEVFGSYKAGDLVENLCPLVERQIHCYLIAMDVEVSPTAMNAAQ